MEDLPSPLIEQGDFVRLKEPYRPLLSGFSPSVKRVLKHLVWEEIDQDEYVWESAEQVPLQFFETVEERPAALEFTHGMVAEIVSRYPAQRRTFDHGGGTTEVVTQFGNERDADPVRNVSLHVFNPETGMLYVRGHPTEPGKPEFVDVHVAELVLIHKHGDSWGTEYELDLVPVYEDWGIEEPAAFDPWTDT